MTEVTVAVISVLVSLLVSIIVNFQDAVKFFSTIVSKERLIWIKDMRELLAELLTICEQYDRVEDMDGRQYASFLKARNGILIRLNPNDKKYPYDQTLLDLLSEPDFLKIKKEAPRIRRLITAILKNEWDKVKVEAGNSRRKVKRVEAIQKQLHEE